MKVSLHEAPYKLSEEEIAYIESLLSAMGDREKLERLFVSLMPSFEKEFLQNAVKSQRFGGVRYNPSAAKDVKAMASSLQKASPIPLFVCSNTEEGANGTARDFPCIGCETKIGAANDREFAYILGKESARLSKQVGVNTLFAPIVDVHNDFHNPVISNRTFGSDPKKVRDFSLQFLKGVQEEGLIACAKHFPGDGFDERDQHLANSVNPLTCRSWHKSFGSIYQSLIKAGLPMVMVGHISLPNYERCHDEGQDFYRPASISPLIVDGLLKGELGFNGLVISDATHMVGLTAAGKREDLLPLMLNAGVDMILFQNDYEEDLSFLEKAIEKGTLSMERVEDALRRQLGLKLRFGLFAEKDAGFDSEFDVTPSLKAQDEVAKKAITLVKDLDHALPLNPEKDKRILLVIQKPDNPFEGMMPKRKTPYEAFADILRGKGYEVTIFESLMDKAKKMPPMEAMMAVASVYTNKTPIKDLQSQFDCVIHLADFDTHNTVDRLQFKMSKGTPDVPWYVHEVKTIFISLHSPFHLFDVPRVRCYINAYDKLPATLTHLAAKLNGEEPFLGISPVDAFCGRNDTKI